MKFVLDTNVFNRVLDGRFTLSEIPDATGFVASQVQFCELGKTRDPVRRAALLETFHHINAETQPAAFSFDIPGAGWDEGKWTDGQCASSLRSDLEALKPKFNNWHDALIAEVALTNGFGLVTGDRNLEIVATKHGVRVIYVAA
jgi:predicted nucleic acid-binding protein